MWAFALSTLKIYLLEVVLLRGYFIEVFFPIPAFDFFTINTSKQDYCGGDNVCRVEEVHRVEQTHLGEQAPRVEDPERVQSGM